MEGMSDDEARTLGERWAKVGGWAPGMLDMDGRRCLKIHENRVVFDRFADSGAIPDFRDGATIGAALPLVRSRLNRPNLVVVPGAIVGVDPVQAAWVAVDRPIEVGDMMCGTGDTEGEALVAAMENGRVAAMGAQ